MASSVIVWSAYCGTIGVLFIILKTINARFHHLFDTTEAVQEPVVNDTSIPSPEDCDAKSKKTRPRNLNIDEE